jgi:hypothetical protein
MSRADRRTEFRRELRAAHQKIEALRAGVVAAWAGPGEIVELGDLYDHEHEKLGRISDGLRDAVRCLAELERAL